MKFFTLFFSAFIFSFHNKELSKKSKGGAILNSITPLRNKAFKFLAVGMIALLSSGLFSPAFSQVANQNALSLPGTTGSYVSIPSSAGLNPTGSITVEAWVNLSSWGSSGSCIVGKGYGNGGESWTLDINPAPTSTVRFYGYIGTNAYGATGAALTTGWHHLVGTYDGTTFRVYVDGIAGTGTVGSGATKSGPLTANTFPVTIGARQSAKNGAFDFTETGQIDEVRIWSIAKSQAQIQTDMYHEISTSTTGLVAYYQFDGTSGQYNDLSGNNNGTPVGSPAPTIVASTAPIPFYSIASGSWVTAGTWAAGQGAPPSASYVNVEIENAVTLNAAKTVGDITIDGPGSLSTTTSNYALTVAGQFTNAGTFTSNASTISLANDLTNSGTFNGNTSTLTISGDLINSGTFTGNTSTISLTDLINSGSLTGPSTINITGDWTNNGGSFTPASNTVNFNGTDEAIGGTTASSFNNISAANSGTISVNTNANAAALTFPGSGSTLSVTSPATLGVAGAVTLNTLAAGLTSCTIAGSGTLNCGSISVGSNATPSSTATTVMTSTLANFTCLNTGGLTINSQGTSSKTNNGTFNLTSGTLTAYSVTTVNDKGSNTSSLILGSSSPTLILGAPTTTMFNLTVTGGSTLTFNGAGATVNYAGAGQTVKVPASGYTNLTLSGTGIKTIVASTIVNGTFSIRDAVTVGGVVPVYGTSSTLEYKLSSPRTANGTQEWPATAAPNVTIYGADITMPGVRTITGNVTLTLGKLILSGNTLTAGSASGGSASSYVQTNGTTPGQLKQTIGSSNVFFPIGNSSYDPITLNNTGTSTSFGINVADATPNNLNTEVVNKEWQITKTATSSSTLNVVPAQYNSGEETTSFDAGSNPVIGFYNGSVWSSQVAATATTGTTPNFTSLAGTTSAAAIAAGSYFALGKDGAFITVPTKLVFNPTAPAGVAAGTSFSVTIQAQDALGTGRNVTTATNITLALASGTGTLGGTLTGTIAAGSSSVTISGITYTKAESGVSITATETSGSPANLTLATTNTFTVAAGAASKLIFTGQPSSTAVEATTLGTITVAVEDANGNVVSSPNVSVILAISNNPGAGSLSGLTTVTSASGTATFTGISINKTGNGYTLSASSGSLTAGTSNGFNITPGSVSTTTSVITATPSSITANGTTTAAVTVQLKDGNSNNLTASIGNVVAITTTLGSISGLTDNNDGTYSATLTSGIVTGTATLGFSVSGTTATSTTTVSFIAGAATKVVFTAQPPSTAVEATSLGTISVAVEDVNNNIVTTSTTITLAIANNAGPGGILSGTTTSGTVAGTFSFTGNSINKTGNGYTLSATSGSVSGTSTSFNITPGAASITTSTISASPSSIVANGVTTSAVTVQLKDGNSNNLTASGGTVLVNTTLGSISSVTDNNNGTYSATLTSGTVSGTATLGFKINTVTASNTTTVAFVAGTATQIALNGGNTQSAIVGTTVTTAPNVIVKDQFGNVVTGATVTFAVASGGGSATGLSAITNSSGIAAVGSWTLGTTVGTNTLTATNGALTGSPITFTATGTVGNAAQIAISGGNSQSVTVGTSLPILPSVIVKDQYGNVVSGTAVTFAVASGGGNATGLSATTNTSGIAMLGSWTLGTAAGSNTLTATSGSLSGSPITFTETGTAGSFSQLQVLLPGELAAAGSATGKTGTPNAETGGTAFNVTVNAVDNNWNIVSSANMVGLSASNGNTMPTNAILSSGTKIFSVTMTTAGSVTITASDITTPSINSNQSSAVTINGVINTWDGSASTLWTTAANWSLNRVPATYDNVVIGNFASGAQPTLSTIVSVNSLTILGRSSTSNTRSGELTITATGALTTVTDVNINGATSSSTDVTPEIVFSGAGSITIGGNLITTNATSGNQPLFSLGAGTLNIAGGITNGTSGTITVSSGTVNYSGANQNIFTTTYNNLMFSGSGTKTAAVGLTINGDLTIGNGTTFASSTFTYTLSGDWINNGALTGASTVNFAGTTTQNITGATSTTFGTLGVTNASSITTLGINTSATNFKLTTGTFDAGTFLLTANTPTFTLGKMRVGAALWANNYSFTVTPPATGTIEYYNTNPTINAGITYQNLTYSGTGTAGASGNLTIQGTLANGTGTLNFGSNNVTFNGSVAANGIDDFTTTGNFIMAKTAGTATLTNNISVGTVSLTGAGTLNDGSNTITVTGTATPTWSKSAGTFTATGTVVFTASGAQTIDGSAATTFDNLTINEPSTTTTVTSLTKAFTTLGNVTVSSGNLIISATDNYYTVNGDLIVPAGSKFTHNVDWATGMLLRVNGNITIDGIYNYTVPRAHVQMGGVNKGIKSNAASAFSILTLVNTTGTITASGVVNINDNFWASFNTSGGTFATGAATVNAKAVLLNAGGIVSVNGGTLNVTGGLLVGTSASPGNVTVSSGTLTTDYMNVGCTLVPPNPDGSGGSSAQTGVFSQSGGTVNVNGSLSMVTSGSRCAHSGGTITITGDLSIGTSTAYTCTNSPVINISGNWINTGAYTRGTETVNFIGAAAQALGSTSTNTFYNLTINNSAANVTLGSATAVTGTLKLTSGLLVLGPNSLTLSGLTNTTAAFGSAITSYVQTNNTGKLIINGIGSNGLNGNVLFPIGNASYNPVQIKNTSTVVNYSVSTANAIASGLTSAISINDNWTITPSSGTPNTAISLQWNAADENASFARSAASVVRGANITSPVPTYTASSGSGPYTCTSATVSTSFTGAFGVTSTLPTITTGTIGGPFCSGSAASVSVPYTVSAAFNTGNVFTAQLSNNNGSFASPVNIGTVSSTTSGTISATIPAGTATGTGYLIQVVSSTPLMTSVANPANIINNRTNFTINAAVPSVTSATTGSNTYGTAGSYTIVGTNNPTSYNTSTLPTGFSISANVINIAATAPAGSYSIILSATNSCGTGNTVTLNYTVNKASLTITANDITKTYGQTLTGAAGSTAFTTGTTQNGEIVASVTIAYGAGAAATDIVGTYSASVTPSAAIGGGTFSADNYSITYAYGTITVTNASLTITANNQAKCSGTTLLFAGTEFSTTGLMNSDAVSSVTLTSNGAASTATVSGSPYTIVPNAATGTGLSNYTITYANGTLIINANTWSGNSHTSDWSDGNNWSCNTAPAPGADIIIPAGLSMYPALVSDVTVNNVTINGTASTLSISGKQLTINGAVNSGGSYGTITGSSTSKLVIAGQAGSITFTPATVSNPNAQTLYNLTVSPVSPNTDASVTLADSIAIAAGTDSNFTVIPAVAGVPGTIKIGSHGTLTIATGKELTLLSDNNNTAQVAEIPENTDGSSAGSIIGSVVVQRFIHSTDNGKPNSAENSNPNNTLISGGDGLRAWHLMTAPVKADTNTPSIFNSWQAGGLTYNPTDATTHGVGTIITGPSANQSTNGFDYTSGASLFYFNPAVNTSTGKQYGLVAMSSTLGNISSASSTGSGDNIGYMLFVRGDRNPITVANPTYGGVFVDTTTISVKGTLQTGRQVFNVLPSLGIGNTSERFTLIGNPYASPIDLNKLTLTNVAKQFFTWNPNLSEVGGYVTLVDDGNGGLLVAAPADTTQGQNSIIQSSQAFFVVGGLASGTTTVTIDENNKSTANNNLVYRPTSGPTESFRSNVYLLNGDGTTILTDGNLVQYSDNYSASVDFLDAVKLNNINETFGLMRDGSLLAIERRPVIVNNDTLFLSLTKTLQSNYRFQFTATSLDHPGLQGYLKDSYTGDSTALNLNGVTNVNFTTNAVAASQSANRFMVVFEKPLGVLPVTFTSIKASQQNSNILVAWDVENEIDIKSYEVEKSTDGTNFTTVGTVKATGVSQYNWIDANAVTGENYYRIRSTGNNGETEYSQIVKVKIGAGAPAIAIYPNPVTNGLIGLQFTNMPKGEYNVNLMTTLGQIIATKTIAHTGGSAIETIPFNKTLAKGTYELQVIKPGNETVTYSIAY